MANKKSRKAKRNQRKRTFSRIVSVAVIVLAVGYFLYKNVPAFASFTDEQVSKAKTAVTNFNEQNANIIEKTQQDLQSQVPENRQKAQEPPQKVTEDLSAETQKPAAQSLVNLSKGLEIPLCKNGSDHERRNYEYYSICYRESYEQAEWSAYCLTKEHLVKNTARTDDFRIDPEISTGSATLADYKGSGYDRGHLSPAADFAFDETAMSETFYMSNMSPQTGSFNRGIWKDLEAAVRSWADTFGRVYVVSGPVLEKPSEEYNSIGADQVSVPEYYYKVLLAPLYKDEEDSQTPEDAESIAAIGFIFPNEKCTGTFFDYAVSIDEVEKRTGLDFFSQLDDGIENRIEAETDFSKWQKQ